MTSFVFDIGEKARRVTRGIGHARSELQRALAAEKKTRKLTQQEVAKRLGVNRSVVNRQLMGTENLTFRSAIEFAWAIGWDTRFELYKPEAESSHNKAPIAANPHWNQPVGVGTGTRNQPPLQFPNLPPLTAAGTSTKIINPVE